MLPAHSPIRRAPLRWFLKASATGFAFGALAALGWARFPHSLRGLHPFFMSGCIGWIFSIVMWGGFEWAGPGPAPDPRLSPQR